MPRSYWSIGPAAVMLVFASSVAQADCSTADLQGTWDAYSVGAEDGSAFWSRCKIRFDASARIRSGSCVDDESDGSTLSGRLSLKRNCRIGGAFTEQFSGGSIRCSIKSTLATSKDAAAGVGECDEGTIFSFDLIKR